MMMRRSMKCSCLACAIMWIWLANMATHVSASEHCNTAVTGVELASERFADGIVVFQPIGAEIDDDAMEIEVVHYRESNDCRSVVVDRYAFEGGEPQLEASFIHPVKGEPNVFAIVSWPMEHRGLSMAGRIYSIYAYREVGAGLALNDFVIQHPELNGRVIGVIDGESFDFEGKDEDGLISLMGSLGKWSWQAACNPEGSQSELTACAYVEQIEAQEALEEVLSTLLAVHADEPHRRIQIHEQLEELQSAWERQTQLELDGLFPLSPGESPHIAYGSSYEMRYAHARAYLLRQRADYLREFWLP